VAPSARSKVPGSRFIDPSPPLTLNVELPAELEPDHRGLPGGTVIRLRVF
jgi:hypothetical protein